MKKVTINGDEVNMALITETHVMLSKPNNTKDLTKRFILYAQKRIDVDNQDIRVIFYKRIGKSKLKVMRREDVYKNFKIA